MSSRMSAIHWASCSLSGSLNPRVVIAGVPMRMPLAIMGGFGSLGTAFLLTVMLALPSAASASFPVSPCLTKLTSSRWLSVPPERMWKPLFMRVSAMVLAFLMTCCW